MKAVTTLCNLIPPAELPEQVARLPLRLCAVQAGFPSPAEDYIENGLNLQEYAVRNPAATYFAHASGDSMTGAGIYDGDLLVIDRSATPRDGCVVVAAVYGELTVKYLMRRHGRTLLVPGNPNYPEIDITENEDALVWGVVSYVLHKPEAQALGPC